MQQSTPVHAWMMPRGPCPCPSTWRPCTSCRLAPRAPPNLLGPSTQAEHHRPCWLRPGLFFSCARPRVPVFVSVTGGQGWGHMAPGGAESRDTQVLGFANTLPMCLHQIHVAFPWLRRRPSQGCGLGQWTAHLRCSPEQGPADTVGGRWVALRRLGNGEGGTVPGPGAPTGSKSCAHEE